jgi:hypothetical protein
MMNGVAERRSAQTYHYAPGQPRTVGANKITHDLSDICGFSKKSENLICTILGFPYNS